MEVLFTIRRLPHNTDIYGVNIDVNYASRSEGTLVCTSSCGKLDLEKVKDLRYFKRSDPNSSVQTIRVSM